MTTAQPILYVNHEARISGAEQSLLDIVRGLDRARYEPAVLLPGAGPLAGALAELRVPCEFLPMQRPHRRAGILDRARFACGLLRVTLGLRRLLRRTRPALVHCNSTAAALYSAAACRLCRVPMLWHCRDLVALGRVGPWIGRHAARVIATSGAVANHLDTTLGGHAETVMIHNGIDTDRFSARVDRTAARQRLALDAHAPVVGNVGQFVPWKKQDRFLQAAANVAGDAPDCVFLLVGSDLFGDHPDYERALRAQARQLGLQERVRFMGQRDDMPSLYAAMDVLLHCAAREPFGRVVAEAMACGTPVVAVDAAGPAELVGNGTSGLLVPADDTDAMARAVVPLLRRPDRRREMGAAARERIARDFSPARMQARLDALYDDIAGAGRSERQAGGT